MKSHSKNSKASFKGLLFREFFIIRKLMVLNLASFVLIAVISLLILLSFRIGNLALLPENIQAEFTKGFGALIDLIITVFAGALVWGCAEAVMRDEFPAWQIFRRTTPVSPWRFALARYIVLAGSCVLGLVCVFFYELFYCAIRDERLNEEKIAVVLVVFALLTAVGVIFQLAMMWLHSRDKAGIVLCVLMMGCSMIIFFSGLTVSSDGDVLEWLRVFGTKFAMKLLPFMPLIFLGILLAGYVCSGFLLKRREK